MKRSKKTSSPETHILAAAVARLSRMLTKDRDRLPETYLDDDGLRHAYLGYFLPVNRAKIRIPLEELARHPAGLLNRDRFRVLDIGSGPGTALLGVMDFFRGREERPVLEFTAVDAVSANLEAAERLIRDEARQYGPATLRTMVHALGSVAGRPEGEFDLIIFSNVMNELFLDQNDRITRRSALLARVMEVSLAAEGSCIIIEPSLRDTSRDLCAVRDDLTHAGFSIYAPCLTQEPCPALLNPRDWCHEDRPWEPPQLIKEIDTLIGLRKDSLKFSYLVIRRDRVFLSDLVSGDAFRVVSEPLVTKGKRELFLCGNGGRRLVMRQNKDAAPENAAFEGLVRGDIVRFEGLEDEGKRLRVSKGTVVLPEGCMA